MSKEKLQCYMSKEIYQKLLTIWYQRRSKDRKSSLSDIVEDAIKQYAAAEDKKE